MCFYRGKGRKTGNGNAHHVRGTGYRDATESAYSGQGQRQIERRRTSHKRRCKTKISATVCAGRTPSGSARTPRPSSLCFRAFWFVCAVIGVCLSRRPRAQRAGDGAATAAPSAEPPTCIKTSTRLIAICLFQNIFPFGFFSHFELLAA